MFNKKITTFINSGDSIFNFFKCDFFIIFVLHRYLSILKEGENIGLEDLDSLQFELEALLSKAVVRRSDFRIQKTFKGTVKGLYFK